MNTRSHFGWAGSVCDFLAANQTAWLEALARHHVGLFNTQPSGSQQTAWRGEWDTMQTALETARSAFPSAADWSVIFEFELPFEGGRRPDVVVLAGDAVVVLEFKGAPIPTLAYLDQVAAYARDLADYHEGSRGKLVSPVLVSTSASVGPALQNAVHFEVPTTLGDRLLNLAEGGALDRDAWLRAPYAPLPTLVGAAQRIFRHEALPHVKRALSARVPDTVQLVSDLIESAQAEERRRLVLVTGVPGAGKTLVGLRVVYEQSTDEVASSTFLSGNGPLVQVLQDALRSTVFVRDLHRFIGSHGTTDRIPKQNVLVFDEAQRAWDRDYMLSKKGVPYSEPQLLIAIADRLPRGATLVGLVGGGQEIYSGEEGGLGQWAEAIAGSPLVADWDVHCPDSLEREFGSLPCTSHDLLHLDVSMRSRRADRLHDWVIDLLAGEIDGAADKAATIQAGSFPMYLTRELDEARAYARARYEDDPHARYGLLASSHAKLLPDFGVDNGWISTSRMKVARWYNEDAGHPRSCCALDQPVTEFGCQGLELDLPIVCWGEDVSWNRSAWSLTPIRRRYPQLQPDELLRNTYRVLLTRGRDGVVIFVPPTPQFDGTADALGGAGMHQLS